MTIITGDTISFTFTIVYSGSSIIPDLSDATVVFAMQKENIYIEKEVVNPTSNNVSFELSAEETYNLSTGIYTGCCKIYFGTGEEKTAWMDNIVVTKGVLGVRVSVQD